MATNNIDKSPKNVRPSARHLESMNANDEDFVLDLSNITTDKDDQETKAVVIPSTISATTMSSSDEIVSSSGEMKRSLTFSGNEDVFKSEALRDDRECSNYSLTATTRAALRPFIRAMQSRRQYMMKNWQHSKVVKTRQSTKHRASSPLPTVNTLRTRIYSVDFSSNVLKFNYTDVFEERDRHYDDDDDDDDDDEFGVKNQHHNKHQPHHQTGSDSDEQALQTIINVATVCYLSELRRKKIQRQKRIVKGMAYLIGVYLMLVAILSVVVWRGQTVTKHAAASRKSCFVVPDDVVNSTKLVCWFL